MDSFKQKAKDMLTTREVVMAAAALAAGAVGAYFFWPVAAAAGASMKAPGAAGFVIDLASGVPRQPAALFSDVAHCRRRRGGCRIRSVGERSACICGSSFPVDLVRLVLISQQCFSFVR